jgi:hypothetical protein
MTVTTIRTSFFALTINGIAWAAFTTFALNTFRAAARR